VSEIVKYGLIRDAALFGWLEQNMPKLLARDPAAVAYAVERSCVNKAAVVAADEREGEAGVRATLNLGHTFGHAIETGTGYGELLHGEAVSIGMVMAADMSVRLGWIDRSILDRTRALLLAAGLPVTPPASMTAARFRDLMAVDKKVLAGKLRLVLLKGPLGGCVVTGDFDPAALDATLAEFCGGR
jgi:3-dehydroquinate synthase